MNDVREPFILGWEEWVALPELGLPSIKAKVDTGAKTSALHAHLIEPFGPASAPMVRFAVHPVPARPDIEVTCSAPVIDRREVVSSNGEREHRYVIETRIAIAERTWPIEVTLTNRQAMSYRMLLGRQAIREDIYVDPISSFRQPKLSYKPYRHLPRRSMVRRSLRIGLLSRREDAQGPSEALAAAATARGHVLEPIASEGLALTFNGAGPSVAAGEAPLPHYDAIIPFMPLADAFGPALVRQFEIAGSYTVNSADALDRLRNPLAVLQTLAQGGLAAPPPLIGRSNAMALDKPEEDFRGRVCCLVVGGSPIAAFACSERTPRLVSAAKAEQRMAVRAAAALRLGMAVVEIADRGGRPWAGSVAAMPPLAIFGAEAGAAAARAIVADVEAHVRSWVHRVGSPEAPSLFDDDDLLL